MKERNVVKRLMAQTFLISFSILFLQKIESPLSSSVCLLLGKYSYEANSCNHFCIDSLQKISVQLKSVHPSLLDFSFPFCMILFEGIPLPQCEDSKHQGWTGQQFCRISGHLKTGYRISGGCRIPDIRPDTGYFNACSLLDRVTQIIETSQIFKQE